MVRRSSAIASLSRPREWNAAPRAAKNCDRSRASVVVGTGSSARGPRPGGDLGVVLLLLVQDRGDVLDRPRWRHEGRPVKRRRDALGFIDRHGRPAAPGQQHEPSQQSEGAPGAQPDAVGSRESPQCRTVITWRSPSGQRFDGPPVPDRQESRGAGRTPGQPAARDAFCHALGKSRIGLPGLEPGRPPGVRMDIGGLSVRS